jgi:hypothetical protein
LLIFLLLLVVAVVGNTAEPGVLVATALILVFLLYLPQRIQSRLAPEGLEGRKAAIAYFRQLHLLGEGKGIMMVVRRMAAQADLAVAADLAALEDLVMKVDIRHQKETTAAEAILLQISLVVVVAVLARQVLLAQAVLPVTEAMEYRHPLQALQLFAAAAAAAVASAQLRVEWEVLVVVEMEL